MSAVGVLVLGFQVATGECRYLRLLTCAKVKGWRTGGKAGEKPGNERVREEDAM